MNLTAGDLALLDALGFDRTAFDAVWAKHVSGRWDRELVIDASRLAPPSPEALVTLPGPGTDAYERLVGSGRDALSQGLVGVVVLNGGMATRFGGVVKGTVEVVDGRSFLQMKIAQIRKVAPAAPLYLMNSPATHEATLAHLGQRGLMDDRTICFVQPVAPRVTIEGEVVREPDGTVSVCGMGHGDMPVAFESQCLEGFVASGCRTVMVSNVDNLGATLDPMLVGLHLAEKRKVSVEVARRRPSDKGGMPVVMDGKLVLLEGLRWPEDMDGPAYRAFNTNTFYIDASVLADPPALEAYPVKKEVRGLTVLQFERILGEITHHVDATFMLVEQEGERSRFIPVKRPEDLESSRALILDVMRSWGVQ